MKLYNSFTRQIEELKPLNSPKVTFYACGPTVYDFTHIGHLRTYINQDVLGRTLDWAGLKTQRVMNITDVGHLSGDDDSGEDKLEKGAKKFETSIDEVVKKFTDYFLDSIDAVNIQRPEILCKATEHIDEMIELIKKLEVKGFTYETDEAVYFDVTKFEAYGALSGQKLQDKIQQAREDVYVDSQKKHPADFAVWFKRVGRFAEHTMHWSSPWGEGFPGWHIECSAMSMKYLGDTIDIHAGGIDHLTVHHENEISQSEAATGKKFVQIWFHSQFLTIAGEKMSKSKGNLYTIDDVKEKGIEPLALRYLFLQSHYRQPLNFTWESLEAAQSGLNNLRNSAQQLQAQTQRDQLSPEKNVTINELREEFESELMNDLQTPKALAVVWKTIKSNIPSEDKVDLLREYDTVLGLNIFQAAQVHEIPAEVTQLAEKRKQARQNGDYAASDQLRAEIQEKGFSIEDAPDHSFLIRKIHN